MSDDSFSRRGRGGSPRGRGRGGGFRGGFDGGGGRGGGRGGSRGRGGWVDRGGRGGSRGRGGWVDRGGRGGSRGRGGGGCFNCGKEGHFSSDCSEPRKPREGGGACFNCGQEGHFSSDCSQPRKPREGGRGRGGGGFNKFRNNSDNENSFNNKQKRYFNNQEDEDEDEDDGSMIVNTSKDFRKKSKKNEEDESSEEESMDEDESEGKPVGKKSADSDEEEEDDDDDDEEEDDEEEDEDAGEKSKKPGKAAKSSSDDEESDSEETTGSFIPLVSKTKSKAVKPKPSPTKILGSKKESSDDEDDEDSDGEEESDDDEPKQNQPKQKLKLLQKGKSSKDEEEESSEDEEWEDQATPQTPQKKTPAKQPNTPATGKQNLGQNKTPIVPKVQNQNAKQKTPQPKNTPPLNKAQTLKPLKKRAVEETGSGDEDNNKKIKIEHSDILVLDADRKKELDARSLFLGNLPDGIDEATLKSLVPKANALRLFVRKNKKKWNRFVFLEFESEDVAEEELIKLKNQTLGGEKLVVDYVGAKSTRIMEQRKPSQTKPLNKKKLFIRGIPPTTTIKDVGLLFPQAEKISLKPHGEVKQTCHVWFATDEEAAEAYKNSNLVRIQDQQVFVLYALKNNKKKPMKMKAQLEKAKKDHSARMANGGAADNVEQEDSDSSSGDE